MVIATALPHWALLSDDERARLQLITDRLVAEKRWEAARGFALTDPMRTLIAANAALLVLELGIDHYRAVRSIIVHPTTMTLTGPRAGPVAGVLTDSPQPILGQAQHGRGPVVVAWDAALRDARHPDRGQNVVFHEFAHKLDMLDGVIDGTPPMSDRAELDRWIEVCTREYEAVRHEGTGLLRSYAGESAGEFFAVSTETFFCRPLAMLERHPELYEVLRDFYRQDPAGRVPRNP